MKKFEKILVLFVALIEREKNEGVICYLLHVSKKKNKQLKYWIDIISTMIHDRHFSSNSVHVIQIDCCKS